MPMLAFLEQTFSSLWKGEKILEIFLHSTETFDDLSLIQCQIKFIYILAWHISPNITAEDKRTHTHTHPSHGNSAFQQ